MDAYPPKVDNLPGIFWTLPLTHFLDFITANPKVLHLSGFVFISTTPKGLHFISIMVKVCWCEANKRIFVQLEFLEKIKFWFSFFSICISFTLIFYDKFFLILCSWWHAIQTWPVPSLSTQILTSTFIGQNKDIN